MMIKVTAKMALVALMVSSCSIVKETDPPLRLIWQSGRSIESTFALVTLGLIDEDRFYTPRERTGDNRSFVAYSRQSGEEVWRNTITGPCSPPVKSGNRVYCPGDALFAFDAATGRTLWTTQTPSTLQLTEGTADAERVYVGTAGTTAGTVGMAFAYNAATGALIWNHPLNDGDWRGIWVRSLTLSPEGDLLIAFEGQYAPPTIFSAAVIVAVDPATGEERWRYVDGGRTTNREIGGLTLWEDLMLYSDPTGQEAVAVNRLTRQVVWRVRYTPDSFSTHRPPLVKDGVAFFTDTQGAVVAVDARTGRQRWRTKRPFGFLSHEVCGDIVFGNDQLGEVFDRATGRPLGRPLGEDDTIGQAAVADNVLYLSAASGVYAFDCTR